jgi:hypothetical protein
LLKPKKAQPAGGFLRPRAAPPDLFYLPPKASSEMSTAAEQPPRMAIILPVVMGRMALMK